MFIKESTLAKLVNGEALDSYEREKITTALAKEAQEREDKKKANQKLRDDIVKVMAKRFPYQMSTSAIKSALVNYCGSQYNEISESKILRALKLLRYEDPRYNVEVISRQVKTPCGSSKRMVFRICVYEDVNY